MCAHRSLDGCLSIHYRLHNMKWQAFGAKCRLTTQRISIEIEWDGEWAPTNERVRQKKTQMWKIVHMKVATLVQKDSTTIAFLSLAAFFLLVLPLLLFAACFFPHSLRRCSCHRLFIDIVVVVVVLIGNPFAGSEIEPCHSMYRFFSRSHSIFFNLSHCSFLLLVCHSILFMVWHIRSNFIPSAISVWNSFFLPRVSIDR